MNRLALLGQHFKRPSTHGTRVIFPFEHQLDDRPLLRQRTGLAILGKGAGGQIPLRIEPLLFQEVIGQQTGLRRAATAEGDTLSLQVCQRGNAGVAAGDKLGGEVDVDITHRHDPARIVQALFDLDVRDRTVPGQVDFSGRERLDERVIAGIQHPVELNALLLEMRLQATKHRDMRQ